MSLRLFIPVYGWPIWEKKRRFIRKICYVCAQAWVLKRNNNVAFARATVFRARFSQIRTNFGGPLRSFPFRFFGALFLNKFNSSLFSFDRANSPFTANFFDFIFAFAATSAQSRFQNSQRKPPDFGLIFRPLHGGVSRWRYTRNQDSKLRFFCILESARGL